MTLHTTICMRKSYWLTAAAMGWIAKMLNFCSNTGYTCDEIEEMLMDTNLLHETLRDVKYMCGESLYENCCGGIW
ncbi:hypothetical protein RF007C_05750 [Ruminococcus flavefaciens 007c]|uniref:Uncharacterized protein n=1 Tax=Ruminococcus flavefaciens 007c TaxID=1341157 RepID=W7UVK6_RUMFL|nr:hypothetical protein RF007C_05750 [Ruminococcus flavefaciens 007c]